MRYTLAWAKTAGQNFYLRLALITVTLALIAVSAIAIAFSQREPLLIERECFSKAIGSSDSKNRSGAEIDAFVRQALVQRFNSVEQTTDLLSERERQARKSEQAKLGESHVQQIVIVSSMNAEGNSIAVDADRLLRVKEIRSSFPFPLKVNIKTTDRTASNPYGLVLDGVAPVVKEKR